MEEHEPSYTCYESGRAAHERGDYEHALELFQQSLAHAIHFKTLELIGETLCRLGRHGESIVPLAAATGLHCGSRAPCLLAEAFAAMSEWQDAKQAAEESLRRNPSYRRAKDVLEKSDRKLTTDFS